MSAYLALWSCIDTEDKKKSLSPPKRPVSGNGRNRDDVDRVICRFVTHHLRPWVCLVGRLAVHAVPYDPLDLRYGRRFFSLGLLV